MMVPIDSEGSKRRSFQGPFQNHNTYYEEFYGEAHNANALKYVTYSNLSLQCELSGYYISLN